MSATKVVLASLSAAMDGGFTAIADVSRAMASAGAEGDYRLIGGVTVMLHIQRLGVDLPLRATGDADFGVPPHVLRRPDLVDAIERLGYHKVFGNRWERQLDERRVAAVDLLVPAYRSRARDTVTIGDVVTTEVPGLAEALRRFSAASPSTPVLLSTTRGQASRGIIKGSRTFTRPAFPSPVTLGGTRVLGLALELHIPPSPAAHVEVGTGF